MRELITRLAMVLVMMMTSCSFGIDVPDCNCETNYQTEGTYCDSEKFIGYINSYQYPTVSSYSAKEITDAFDVFEMEWGKLYPSEIINVNIMLNNICIIWTEDPFEYYGPRDENGNLPLAAGQTLSPFKIKLWVVEPDLGIYTTGLTHEFIHILIYYRGDKGYAYMDSDHDGDKYDGWKPEYFKVISEINRVIKEELYNNVE